MERHVVIRGDEAEIKVELAEGPTAEQLLSRLPIEARAQLWGEEIYFSVPVFAELQPGAREVVEVGDAGYWPPGDALCLFFGRTPAADHL